MHEFIFPRRRRRRRKRKMDTVCSVQERCFENLPTWFKALCKKHHALSTLCYLSVAKNDPKKDMRKTTGDG
jgi:hypothetical protein